MENIIKAQGIYKNFGNSNNVTEILKNVNITVNAQEFVSLMGPSGCGKSTLLYILGGLDTPTKGIVEFCGKDINKMKDREKSKIRCQDIGFVFQFYNLVQNLSVEENILLPLVMNGYKAKNLKNELDEILDIVGLKGKRKHIPKELSGGQQQRVSIARAVITNPKLILADEPIGNLDSKSGIEIMNLFKRINEEKGITIFQVTHSEESALYGKRIIRMKDGNIEKDELLHG